MHIAEFEQENTLFFVMVTFLIGGLIYHNLRFLRLPFTVIMFIFGLFCGLLTKLSPTFVGYFTEIVDIKPELVMHLFLPVLIFEGAFNIEVHIFFDIFFQAMLLAGPGVLMNTCLTAIIVKLLLYTGWNWGMCFLFGSLMSATDPVAVINILNQMGADKRLTAITNAEAIMNDGTAIICFVMLQPLAVGGSLPPWYAVIIQVLRLTVGAAIVGLSSGWLLVKSLQRCYNEPLVEVSLTVAFPYVTFYIADAVVGTSGVLTTCALGVYLAANRTSLSPSAEHAMHHTWEFICHLGNTIIFALIGLIIGVHGFKVAYPIDYAKLIVLYFCMTELRALMLTVFTPLLNRWKFQMDLKNGILLTHGGLRGPVAFLLSLSISEVKGVPEEIGMKIVFLCGGIVIITLLFNGATSLALASKLGLNKKSDVAVFLGYLGFARVIREMEDTIHDLQTDPQFIEADWEEALNLTAYHAKYSNQFPAIQDLDVDAAMRNIVMRCFKIQLWELHEQRVIHSSTLIQLSKIVNGRISDCELINVEDLERVKNFPWYVKLSLRVFPKSWTDDQNRKWIATYHEAHRAYADIITHIIEVLPQLKELGDFRNIMVWANEQQQLVRRRIDELHTSDSLTHVAVATLQVSQLAINRGNKVLSRLRHDGLLSRSDANNIQTSVEEMERVMKDLFVKKRNIHHHEILAKTAFVKAIPNEQLKEKLLSEAVERRYHRGDTVTSTNSIRIIVRGVVRCERHHIEENIGAYSCLGITRMLLPHLRVDHVVETAESDLVLFEFPTALVKEVASRSPAFQAQLWMLNAPMLASYVLKDFFPYSDMDTKTRRDFCKKGTTHYFDSQVQWESDTQSSYVLLCGSDTTGHFVANREPVVLPLCTRFSAHWRPHTCILQIPNAVPCDKDYSTDAQALGVPLFDMERVYLFNTLRSLEFYSRKPEGTPTRCVDLHLGAITRHCYYFLTAREALIETLRLQKAQEHIRKHKELEHVVRVLIENKFMNMASATEIHDRLNAWIVSFAEAEKEIMREALAAAPALSRVSQLDQIVAESDWATVRQCRLGEREMVPATIAPPGE